MTFDTYVRECAWCGCAIFVTVSERDVPAWLCPTCGRTEHASPLTQRETTPMTETQGWFLVVELGVVALAYLVTMLRR